MYPFHRIGRGSSHRLAGCDIPRHRYDSNVRVSHDRRAHRFSIPGDHVEDARRKDGACVFSHHQRCKRRLLGWLRDADIARCQRRADLPDCHHQWVVPRRDLSGDTNRFAAYHRCVPTNILSGRRPLEASRRTCEEAEVVHALSSLMSRIHQGLANVLRLQAGEHLEVLVDRIGQPEEERRSLTRRCLKPAWQSTFGGGDGTINVRLGSLWHSCDGLAGRRVNDRGSASIHGVHPLPTNEVLFVANVQFSFSLVRCTSWRSSVTAFARLHWHRHQPRRSMATRSMTSSPLTIQKASWYATVGSTCAGSTCTFSPTATVPDGRKMTCSSAQ